MSYQSFAHFYDYLMKDAPYDAWVTFVSRAFAQNNSTGKSILDIGCGTGELAIRLAQDGYAVSGVDLSEEMLIVATEKMVKNQVDITFFQQDMRSLSGLGQYDMIILFCDSLNYLTTKDDVIHTFKNVSNHLADNGLFLFDVHSVFKMKQLFTNQSYCDNDDDVSYIWNAWEGPNPNSVEHELTFFVYDEITKQYRRFDEDHIQQTFSVKEYEQLVTQAGFEVLDILGDFTCLDLEEAERIFFICKKKAKQ